MMLSSKPTLVRQTIGNANICLRPMSSYILEAQIDGDLWSDARTTYTFQVRALGSLGQSDWSDVATRICQ